MTPSYDSLSAAEQAHVNHIVLQGMLNGDDSIPTLYAYREHVYSDNLPPNMAGYIDYVREHIASQEDLEFSGSEASMNELVLSQGTVEQLRSENESFKQFFTAHNDASASMFTAASRTTFSYLASHAQNTVRGDAETQIRLRICTLDERLGVAFGGVSADEALESALSCLSPSHTPAQHPEEVEKVTEQNTGIPIA